MAGKFLAGDFKLGFQLDDFGSGVDIVLFMFQFFAHLFLPLGHHFPDFFHVEIWYFGLFFGPDDFLDLVRKENGELRTVHVTFIGN